MAGGRLSWKDVRARIHDEILTGTLAPGEKLPRDADIAAKFNCARATVQRAMHDLSDSGLIERRRKGGSRVRLDPVTRAVVDIPVIRQEVEQKGGRYSYQLIRQSTEAAPRPVLAAFGLTSARDMLHIEALHLSDRQPYILEDRWVCPQTVPEILSVDLTVQSANEWLVRHRPFSACDLHFHAQMADESSAALLHTTPGEALFVLERTTWVGPDPITTVKAISAPGYRLVTRI